jgi:hypothetical protein
MNKRDNVAIVGGIYERWNAGDLETAIGSMHADVEY